MKTAARYCACGLGLASGQRSREDCPRCQANRKEHGDDKQVVTFVFHRQADSHGRRPFAIWWWDERFHSGPGWRVQEFFTDPASYLKKEMEKGLKVRTMEKE